MDEDVNDRVNGCLMDQRMEDWIEDVVNGSVFDDE